MHLFLIENKIISHTHNPFYFAKSSTLNCVSVLSKYGTTDNIDWVQHYLFLYHHFKALSNNFMPRHTHGLIPNKPNLQI